MLAALTTLSSPENSPFPTHTVRIVPIPFQKHSSKVLARKQNGYGMGPNLRSRPSCFHRTSMSWIICRVSMSWRRSVVWEGDTVSGRFPFPTVCRL